MDVQLLILGLLQEARNQHLTLVRTALLKYLYLLDVYSAEAGEGAPVSGVTWQFLHFGPYSVEAVRAMEDLSSQGLIFTDRREAEGGDREFFLYSLREHHKVQDLREIGVFGKVQNRINADMKRYKNDLSRLLNFVYFQTAPMLDAQPGDTLDFSACIKVHLDDVRHVEMLSLRPKAIKEIRNKLRTLMQSRKSLPPVEQGLYDEAYYSAMEILDGDPLETGVTGKAKIKV